MKRKNYRLWLAALLVLCMGIIVVGGMYYVSNLRQDLAEQAIANVMTVTRQQEQAFDNFISGDRERLHSYAKYFSRIDFEDPGEIQQQLTMFDEVEAVFSVIDLDEGWFCSNSNENIRQLDERDLKTYRAFTGSGVRDSYIGVFSGNPKFGFYEVFTFANGHQGLVQKSYDQRLMIDTFSLSFYNDRGLAYVVNQSGDILLHSNGMMGTEMYDNILSILSGSRDKEQRLDGFMEALNNLETGSQTFVGDAGIFVYTYVPVESVEGWYLVSVVPMTAITAETDRILMQSQAAVLLLMIILVVCAAFGVLMWRTYREVELRDQEIDYQEQLFNIFSTYLSNNTDDVYLMLDLAEEDAEYVSPNMERVLGISPQNIAEALKTFGEGDSIDGGQLDMETLCSLEPGDMLETLRTEWINPRTQEHKWFRISVYCTRIQDEDKIVVYISDRTYERRTQDALSEALNLARVASDAKSSFLSSVSHDIRTPMNAIIGLVALLREEADNPEVVLEYTQRIDAASQHLLGLINDVLDMNKIESGSASLNLSELSMADIIEEINTIIRPQAKAKDQNFDIFVSSLVYEHLQGDKLRINQILINLLSNAVKYTPAGGSIQMRVEELPQVVENYSRIRFTISDNGMGMSQEYLKVIFDPFTREDTTAIRQIQGTGLGMAITKSLVDLMGGTIEVESELGKGSTFTVEVEFYIQAQKDDPKFWEEHKVARMIVADDDEEICLTIVKTMSKTGVEVDYATSGAAAIQMMRTAREAGHPYDLILLDWKMPDLDGLETARLIRKNYPEKIPILLLTAYDWGEIEQEAREIGVSHFMPKPFFMTTFIEAIRRVMGSQKKTGMATDSVVRGKHILVVDDIEVNRIILVKILATLGASCDIASNGQEALEHFEASQPGEYDVILMDVQMPVMDGYSATRAIRSSGHPYAKDVPIIAMTANAFVDDVRDAIDSGMDAHIAKPVQVDKLKSTIQQVLESRAETKTDYVEGSI